MGIPTSIIISLVISSLITIAALVFMIIAIVQQSSCESTESSQCATFNCPNETDPSKTGAPAIRP